MKIKACKKDTKTPKPINIAGIIYGVRLEKICSTRWSPNIFQNNLSDKDAGLTK